MDYHYKKLQIIVGETPENRSGEGGFSRFLKKITRSYKIFLLIINQLE